jgi:5-methylcytosine-specific restriction endonuclease McrA
MDYRTFIGSAQWKALRKQQLLREPFCCFCKQIATQVDHIKRCGDDPLLQTNPSNLRSVCAQCHAPLRHNDKRGYSREIDPASGWYVDPKHPSNRR